MNPLNYQQNKQGFKRIKEIISVLVKFGFGYLVERIQLKSKLPFIKRFRNYESTEELDSTVPKRVRLVLEELGPTFIKFGQILSTRQDLIGNEFVKEFSKLQDNTPSFSYDQVETTIENELGSSISSLFVNFDQQPLASASLGQVHKATLKNGDEVVVKVQRPHIHQQITEDIKIMRHLAGLVNKHLPSWRYYNLSEIINEFERSVTKELNYQLERRNINKFRLMFKDDKTIFVPQSYPEYSTKHILTMEFVKGIKLNDLIKSKKSFDKKLIAKRGADSFFKQVLIHGFFHADPHPGNIFILENSVICFIDFGMMGHIDKSAVDDFAHLFTFLINYNLDGLINQLTDMELINETVDLKSFKYDVTDIMDLYYGAELKEIQLGEITNKLMMLLVKYKVTIPREMVLLSRALVIISGIGTTLDPDFNAVEVCNPLAKKVIKQRTSPKHLINTVRNNVFEFEHLVKILPKSLKGVLNKLVKGKINIELEHKNLDRFSNNLERVSNKLSFAMIISALIVGSSLIMQTNKGVLLFGFPILGILGFSISAIIGLGLIISIIKFKKI